MPTPRKTTNITPVQEQKQLAKRIIDLRKVKGWTQTELAEKIGISRNLYSNYELGRTHMTDEIIIALAKVFKVSTDDILGISKNNKEQQTISSVRIVKRMQQIEKLSSNDQKVILRTIDNYLKGANQTTDD